MSYNSLAINQIRRQAWQIVRASSMGSANRSAIQLTTLIATPQHISAGLRPTQVYHCQQNRGFPEIIRWLA